MEQDQPRSLPATATEIFTEDFVPVYVRLSAAPSRGYENNAKRLAGLDADIPDGSVVLEIGSGTGTSTVAFAEALSKSNPNFRMLVGVEPSRPFLEVAKSVFKKEPTDPEWLGGSLNGEESIKSYLKELNERGRGLRGKVAFINARADGTFLPVADNSVDRIYLASAFHWLAFEDDRSRDVGYLDKALADFQRVLKPGGKLIFDSSGLQFDTRDETNRDLPVNEMAHPFRIRFLRHFNNVLRETGHHVGEDIAFASLDRFFQIFNWEFIKNKLSEFGFEPVPQKDGRPYHLRMVEFPVQEIAKRVREARMSFFNAPVIKDLGQDQKESLIEAAYQRTLADPESRIDLPGAEIMVGFVFRKV